MNPHVLIIDGYNFLHRARSGFTKGEYAIVFNFVRNLRAQVELHKPTRVIIALEGHPAHRHEISEEYKANRRVDVSELSDAQISELENFNRQKNIIIELLAHHFPVSLMRHPSFEGDDVIYNIIKRASSAVQYTVVSNDSDFIQLLDDFDNVKIWNPMKKEYVEKPPYDYLMWKCLCGDSSDNIKGIPGVGKKTAEKLAIDDEKRKKFFADDPTREDIWAENFDMIKFFDFSDHDLDQVITSTPNKDEWKEAIHDVFERFRFNSLLKEKTFNKFIKTFEPLW